ncbi:MAG: oxidative stress defense protein [Parcubacteria bacterium OLB19]|nr:MAG: oxidative stress defense protein [Parcubacteria bacterium OLB19]
MGIKNLFDYSVPLVSAATILTVGAVVVASIGAYTAYDIKLSRDSVEVTGSAKESVVSDTARWIINLDTKTGVNEQQVGYTRLDRAVAKIVSHLESQGFTDYETPSVTSFPNYTYPQYGEPIMTGFTVSRQIIVRSNDIDKISLLANNIEPFTGLDYNVTTQALELTYSKLDEMRVELLSEAIKDAKARAEAIASESGRSVGILRNASGGVVQVLPQGGVEISDYGLYDTQSKNKEIMVTVRANFEL